MLVDRLGLPERDQLAPLVLQASGQLDRLVLRELLERPDLLARQEQASPEQLAQPAPQEFWAILALPAQRDQSVRKA